VLDGGLETSCIPGDASVTHPIGSSILSAAVTLLIACQASSGFARSPFAASADPASEERERIAKTIETKLIAPCCGTQPVATHYSPAADQVRAEIRRLLAGGATQQQVLEAYVAKYGEQILAQPRGRGFGLLAWTVPPLALLAAAVGLLFTLRGWTRAERNSAADVGAESVRERSDDDSYRERLRVEIDQFDR
jgi:cytochrome c-type biogenesis protein CcmH